MMRCSVGDRGDQDEGGITSGISFELLLVSMVMDEVRQEIVWIIMFADDAVISSESRWINRSSGWIPPAC